MSMHSFCCAARRLGLLTLLLVLGGHGVFAASHPPTPALKTADFDRGWRLLLDPPAKWQNDTLYLPDEVNLPKMPVNPPTRGWVALNAQAGIPVSLPSTVEQHFWGQPPSGTAASAAPTDIVNAAGNYTGVSWWFRPFICPKLRSGERLVFSFPGAHLRAEVYVNGTLVGYNLIGETAFTADATQAFKPGGPNLLAVRITNPGGRLDWIDFLTMHWGRYTLPATHAFGGLDGDVTMSVQAPVSVTDLAVFNHPDPKTVTMQAQVSTTGTACDSPVTFSIRRHGKTLWTGTALVHVPAGGTATVTKDATVGAAKLWGIDHPMLYSAMASLPGRPGSGRSTTFGFRWFAATGIGTNAHLTLNGRRIVPRSAISWGFWAPNGLFPDRAAADREVAAVRVLGLTALQNHRHMPKPIVLDAFDRAGLLRWCEPGGGLFAFEDEQGEKPSTLGPIDTSGAGAEPTTFLARYELAKVLAMIKANRSHPSVIVWTLQNEVSPDLHNPLLFYVLRKMREADPSRIILLKSGIFPQNQVWSLPYSSDWMHDDGTGYSGWWDQHTATVSACVFQDGQYHSPTDFLYHSGDVKQVVTWGEMATGASPDDHAADAEWHKANGMGGYDLAAHQALLTSYDKFLNEYGFRSTFPTAESLFLAAGNKHYFEAARLLENARMCDANDYLVLSGWESTTIDDHSGLTDSLRFLKGDPSMLKQACAPEMLVVRPRHFVLARGESVTVDVHIVNENNLYGPCQIRVTAAMTGKKPFFATAFPVTVIGGEVFGQLLKAGIVLTPEAAGPVTIRATLFTLHGLPLLTRTAQILVVDTQPAPLTGPVAFAGASGQIGDALQKQFGVMAVPLAKAHGSLQSILVASQGGGVWQSFNVPARAITNTPDPDLYAQQLFGPTGPVHTYRDLTPGKVTVELFFADTYATQPGQRVFDVALNGQTVLKDFDIFHEAGGQNRALVKTFTINAPQGIVALSVPGIKANNATFAAIRLQDAAGSVIWEVFRRDPYHDAEGNVWNPIVIGDFDWGRVFTAALPRVHDDGTRLVLLTSGGSDAAAAASFLAAQHIVTYSGEAGGPGPSWLGFWYFGRPHWLLDGLPANGVLDWPYQIGDGNGLFLSGSNVEAVIGYGKNHDPKIGIGAAIISYGRGKIVMLDLPGLSRAFTDGNADNFQPVTAKRIIYNALHAH